MNQLTLIKQQLHQAVTIPEEKITRFFKTGKGDYAEHDIFIGVTNPNLRKIAKQFRDLNLTNLQTLLSSPIHEERFLALVILTEQFKKNRDQNLYDFYLDNTQSINNWDLVDCSAHLIVGAYLYDKERSPLLQLVRSQNLWERRIAIVATWAFIRKDDLDWTFKLAKQLIDDEHDLIHKATGWMLREAGKRDVRPLLQFLDQHAATMPRTMLRVSLEKLTPEQKSTYMNNPA